MCSSWASLTTEADLAASAELDLMSSAEVVRLVADQDRLGVGSCSTCAERIAQAADWFAEAFRSGGDVIFVGAGTSGRLGVLEAAECPPTFGTSPERIRAVIAGGREAVFEAVEGAEDDAAAGRAVGEQLQKADLCIGISASSVTPYVRSCLEVARERGIKNVLVTCAAEDSLRDVASLVIGLDTGAEVLSGSTRLKAGSATKAALNSLTLAAMVQLGKVHGNRMVDLRQGSRKLRDRARRIVAAVCELDLERAAEVLEQADGEVKTAIVMSRCGVNAATARRRLEQADGFVRRAISGDREPYASEVLT